jgi:RNA polymerase sigma-70 factor (ECF subfamily)
VITIARRDSKPHSESTTAKIDSRAFIKVIHTFYDSVYRFCASQVSDPIDAEDLTQEVFVSAYANAHQLRNPEQLRQWLLSIAYNLSRRLYRQKYRGKAEIFLEDIAPNVVETIPGLIATAAEEEALDQPEFSPLYTLMDSMPDRARESLDLHCMENMSYEDIARLLNVPISTVKGRIYNARQWLLTNGLASSTPGEVRQQIARAVTDVVRDYSTVRETLSEDLLENQLILALLHPLRISYSDLKAYTFGTGKPKNMMMVMDIHSKDIAVIKADTKIAISAFLQLLPEDKPIYIMLTNPETWSMMQNEYDAEATKSYYTYGLISREHNRNLEVSDVSEITSGKGNLLKLLSQKDRYLKNILECMKLDDDDYLDLLRLFVHYTTSVQKPNAYAVFAYSGIGNLWELVQHSSTAQNSNTYLQKCIALGTKSLLNQGCYVTVNTVAQEDTESIDLLKSIGFANLFTQMRVMITIQ